MDRNGYWVQEFGDGEKILYKIENDFETYIYTTDGDWAMLYMLIDVGWSDDFSKINKHEARKYMISQRQQ